MLQSNHFFHLMGYNLYMSHVTTNTKKSNNKDWFMRQFCWLVAFLHPHTSIKPQHSTSTVHIFSCQVPWGKLLHQRCRRRTIQIQNLQRRRVEGSQHTQHIRVTARMLAPAQRRATRLYLFVAHAASHPLTFCAFAKHAQTTATKQHYTTKSNILEWDTPTAIVTNWKSAKDAN